MLALNRFAPLHSEVAFSCLAAAASYPITPPKVYSSELFAENSAAYWSSMADADPAMHATQVDCLTLSHASVYLTGGRHAVCKASGEAVSIHRVNDELLASLPWLPHKHLSGTTLLLGNSAGANCYYHWMMDVLPKLGYLQEAGVDLNRIDHFLVREIAHPFQTESLAQLGIGLDRVVETARHPYWTCDSIKILNLVHNVNLAMHPMVPQWVKRTFSTHTPNTSASNAPTSSTSARTTTEPTASTANDNKSSLLKLFIQRPAGVRRGVINQEELTELLESHDFQSVTMEGMTIRQQAELFKKASVIVSTHGGALTNMVYAAAGTIVVELFGHHVYPYYWGLANLCGHDYHAVLQSPDDLPSLVQVQTAMSMGTAENQAVTQRADFSVDCAAVEQCLTAIG